MHPGKNLQQPAKHNERRNFTRFTPKNGTMAVNSHALGPIVNISMGGLAFRYMETEKTQPVSDQLGIFLGSDDFLIEKIESRLIADTAVEQDSTFMQTKTRQRSIEFLNLTSEQQEKLEEFILTKTQGVT